MEHGHIITDLMIVTVCASIVAIIFRLLKLPLLLGYIISGILVGPHLFVKNPLVDIEVVQDFSELGVAFLMFYIGLEFDLKKLQRALGPALLTVILQTVGMVVVGLTFVKFLGWSSVNGLFLGCILAISSTMVTVAVLKGQDALKANFAQLAIGILILEDILAILILVVLSGESVTGRFAWGEVWQMTFFVGVFVVVVFCLGKLLAPYILKVIKRYGSSEMITVVAVAMLLGIGKLADEFHFSIALGAFLAGSILSQHELAHKIENAIEPLKDLFTAVFFVTVGMLIDPSLLGKYWLSIIFLTVVVLVAKTIFTWTGLFLAGQKPKAAFLASIYKAQIGEFSFVIAGLGLEQKIVEPGLMAVTVGVALSTITVAPILSKRSVELYGFFEKLMPQRLADFGQIYGNFIGIVKEHFKANAFLSLIKKPFLQVILYFLLFNGVILTAYLTKKHLLTIEEFRQHPVITQNAIWGIAILVCLPFLIAMIRNLEVIILLILESAFAKQSIKTRNILNTTLLSILVIGIGGIYISLASPFLPTGFGLAAFIGLLVVLGFFLWRYLISVNSQLELFFKQTLSYDVRTSLSEIREKILQEFSQRHPWPIIVQDVPLEPGTLPCGQKIEDLNLREKTGITIVGITRDNYTGYNPGPGTPLFPGDHLIIIGKEAEVEHARQILSQKQPEGAIVSEEEQFKIDTVFLSPASPIVGQTLADANIRRKYYVNVIGIQRGERQISAPAADEVFKQDDLLVVVGNQTRMAAFKKAVEVHAS